MERSFLVWATLPAGSGGCAIARSQQIHQSASVLPLPPASRALCGPPSAARPPASTPPWAPTTAVRPLGRCGARRDGTEFRAGQLPAEFSRGSKRRGSLRRLSCCSSRWPRLGSMSIKRSLLLPEAQRAAALDRYLGIKHVKGQVGRGHREPLARRLGRFEDASRVKVGAQRALVGLELRERLVGGDVELDDGRWRVAGAQKRRRRGAARRGAGCGGSVAGAQGALVERQARRSAAAAAGLGPWALRT